MIFGSINLVTLLLRKISFKIGITKLLKLRNSLILFNLTTIMADKCLVSGKFSKSKNTSTYCRYQNV